MEGVFMNISKKFVSGALAFTMVFGSMALPEVMGNNPISENQIVADAASVSRPANVSNFKVAKTDVNSVKLSWKKVSGAKGYIIYKYDTSKKKWVRVKKTATNVNSYTVPKLKAGTTYKFAIKAYKTVRGKEVLSAKYGYPTITTSTNPAKVTELKATTAQNSIKLTWKKVTGATGYIVYRYDTSKKTWVKLKTLKTNSYTVSKLKKATTYKFAVKAYRTVNKKNYYGAYPTVTAITNIPKVSGLKVYSVWNNSNIGMYWNKLSDADGYIVYKYNSSKKAYEKVGSTTKTAYTVKGLEMATEYKVAVKAYKKVNGKTVLSEGYVAGTVRTSTIPVDESTVEISVSKVDDSTRDITITWGEVKGCDKYLVYRGTKQPDGERGFTEHTEIKGGSNTKYVLKGVDSSKEEYFLILSVKNSYESTITTEYYVPASTSSDSSEGTCPEGGDHEFTETYKTYVITPAYDETVSYYKECVECSCGLLFYYPKQLTQYEKENLVTDTLLRGSGYAAHFDEEMEKQQKTYNEMKANGATREELLAYADSCEPHSYDIHTIEVVEYTPHEAELGCVTGRTCNKCGYTEWDNP